MNDSILPYVKEVKDLGIYFTPDLNFKQHISFIVSKAFRMQGFINCVTKSFNDATVLQCLYFSYVRSCLEYGSQIWAPTAKTYIDTIERVQRKFIKKLCFVKRINYDSNNYLLKKHHRFQKFNRSLNVDIPLFILF